MTHPDNPEDPDKPVSSQTPEHSAPTRVPARRDAANREAPGAPSAQSQIPNPKSPIPDGRFAYGGLERVIHERARLSIMTSLAAHPRGVLFNDLRQMCSLTDGNLNRHLAVLEEAGLIEAWKGHRNRRPQTLYRLTESGGHRLVDYIAELERVLADAAAAEKHWAKETGGRANPGVRPT